jgi:CheY-like chemotaxis protein
VKTILVLDDDPGFRALVRSLVAPLGYALDEAGSLAEVEAIEAIAGAAPQVAVIDGRLADGNGLEWAVTLVARAPETAVVFATASEALVDEARSRLGARELVVTLAKPVGPSVLRRALVGLLRKRERLGADTDPTPRPFELAMSALRDGYRAELPAKIDTLVDLVTRALATRGSAHEDVASTRELVALAHRLRGTAGSYGFGEIGELAGELEDAVTKGTLSDAWPHAEARLAALRLDPK